MSSKFVWAHVVLANIALANVVFAKLVVAELVLANVGLASFVSAHIVWSLGAPCSALGPFRHRKNVVF